MWLSHIFYYFSEGQALCIQSPSQVKSVSPQQREGSGDATIPHGLCFQDGRPEYQAADSCYLLSQTPDVNHLGCQGKCELFSKQWQRFLYMASFRNCQAGKLCITQASLFTGNLKLQKNTTLRKYLAGLPCWKTQNYVFKELLLPTHWTGLTDLPHSLFPPQGGTGSGVNTRVNGISSHKLPTPTGRVLCGQ